jgi:hypothetical protein
VTQVQIETQEYQDCYNETGSGTTESISLAGLHREYQEKGRYFQRYLFMSTQNGYARG